MKVRRCKLHVDEVEPTGLRFWCPGCGENHVVALREGGWKWNGDEAAPTIDPSVKCEQPKWDERARAFVPDKCCHAVITAGMIRFCGDTTHRLVNQTVLLPELPEEK